MKTWLTALAAASLSLAAAVTANAGTISIGYSQDGAAITTVAGSGVTDSFSIRCHQYGLLHHWFH